MKRREFLEKKRATEGAIRAASAVQDHLTFFPSLCNFTTNGLSVFFESGRGDKLPSSLKQYIQSLLKINMEGPYGSEWLEEAKAKRAEMVAPDARYIFIYEVSNGSASQVSVDVARGRTSSTTNIYGREAVVGFVHFRFTAEEEIPVLYVYELQLEPRVQGKGLGKFLMQLIELIAEKNHMAAVMLTVLKANKIALNFYTSKLRYNISNISPSRVDPQMGVGKSYEILCKALSDEAKSALES